jgi:hypothetical protein
LNEFKFKKQKPKKSTAATFQLKIVYLGIFKQYHNFIDMNIEHTPTGRHSPKRVKTTLNAFPHYNSDIFMPFKNKSKNPTLQHQDFSMLYTALRNKIPHTQNTGVFSRQSPCIIPT